MRARDGEKQAMWLVDLEADDVRLVWAVREPLFTDGWRVEGVPFICREGMNIHTSKVDAVCELVWQHESEAARWRREAERAHESANAIRDRYVDLLGPRDDK